MKRTGKLKFFIALVLVVAFVYTAFFGISSYFGDTHKVYIKGASDIRWGIDIVGGVEAVFSPDVKDAEITDNDMDAAKEIIETRLLSKNITDSEVYTDYDKHHVIVRFPWQEGEEEFDPSTAVAELGETAQLNFYIGSDNSAEPFMNGGVVKSATPGFTDENGFVVQLKLDSKGADAFASATAQVAGTGTPISIYMDETLVSSATCAQTITGGEAIIYGDFTSESATELASKITAGSLPFALTVDDSKLQVISPTLGKNALNAMLIAGVIAFAVICVMLIVRYRLCGVVSSITLLGQIAGVIACVSGYFNGVSSYTLTIPGIAGIILSIGIGVDANVIICERIREEFRNGKTIDGSLDAGFKRAFSAVVDGNLTNLIVAVILMAAFGTPDSILAKCFSFITAGLFTSSITGSVFSFGFTLLAGVIFNLVMGVFASRVLLKGVASFKFLRRAWLYGGAKRNG